MNYPTDETLPACPPYKQRPEWGHSTVALSTPKTPLISGRKKFGKITAGVGGNGGNAQLTSGVGGAGGTGGKFTLIMAAQTEYEVGDMQVGTGGAGGHGKEGGGAGAGGEVKITEELPHQIVEKNEHIVRFMPSGY